MQRGEKIGAALSLVACALVFALMSFGILPCRGGGPFASWFRDARLEAIESHEFEIAIRKGRWSRELRVQRIDGDMVRLSYPGALRPRDYPTEQAEGFRLLSIWHEIFARHHHDGALTVYLDRGEDRGMAYSDGACATL